MDTVRVDLVYRPIRICWAIAPGDTDAFRQVVRLNFAFWGGRFNPILVVDGTEKSDRLVEAFRPDFIVQVAHLSPPRVGARARQAPRTAIWTRCGNEPSALAASIRTLAKRPLLTRSRQWQRSALGT
jgi:hypothetical protein